jgi:Recombination endonuclease VII
MTRYWSCPCGTRNERIKQTCTNPECDRRRPKRRVTAHARTLRDDPYARYVEVAREIHGVTDESCCVCGKPRSQERRCDRDHDHHTGLPRGLACPGDRGCNVLMLPWVTAVVARAIACVKLAAVEPDAERWVMIARYLERVEAYYKVAA